jgi:hypothetical protein
MRAPSPETSRPGALSLAVLAAVVLALAPPGAHAQWKWRDKSGQVNASDRAPPLDVPEKDILARPSPAPEQRRVFPAAPASAASGAEPLRPLAVDRSLEARRRAAEQEQAGKTKAEEERLAAQRAENCRRARGHLSAMESGQRIARVNDKGEREVLDDRGRADEMRQAREVIASDCR